MPRLDRALSGADTVGFAWVPLRPEDAMGQVADWTAAPSAVVVGPTPWHVGIVTELLAGVGAGGNLVNDTHLAALAAEDRAVIVSYDNDFARFGVRWDRPGDLV